MLGKSKGGVFWRVAVALATAPLWAHAQVVPQADPPSSSVGAERRCGDIVLKGSKALFATSPRADRDAEALALQSSGALVAPDDQYRRFAADLAAIRKAKGV